MPLTVSTNLCKNEKSERRASGAGKGVEGAGGGGGGERERERERERYCVVFLSLI